MPANPSSLDLLERYHDQLIALRDRTARVVDGLYQTVDPRDLGNTFQGFVRGAQTMTEVGQAQAKLLASAFIASYVTSETGTAAEIVEAAPNNEGFTTDGRSLGEAMGAIPAKVYLALKQGRSVQQALVYGRFAVNRFVQTEVMDAASQEMSHQFQELDLVQGWRWKSRGTCGGCLAMDNGKRFDAARPLNRHPNCRCIAEPVLNVPQSVQRDTGRERFFSLSEPEQDAALGKGIADLVRRGAVAWADLASTERPHEWHPLVVAATLKEVAEAASN
jgi:hypothetical protein